MSEFFVTSPDFQEGGEIPKEFGYKLEDADKSRLENTIKELKEVRTSEDMEGIEDLTEKLDSMWQEISTKLYQNTTEDESNSAPQKDEVTDVEYEEVKE